MGGLFQAENREERFVEEGRELVETLKFIKTQLRLVDLPETPDLDKLIGYMLYVMVNTLYNGSRLHPTYKHKDKDYFFDELDLPFETMGHPAEIAEVKEYFWRLEHRVRTWALVYKDILAKTPDAAKLLKLYAREANSLLNNEI